MIKNEMKAALAIMGVAFVPVLSHADQAASNTNSTYGSKGNGQQATYLPGEKVRDGELPAGYNQSAAYVCDNGWDVFLTLDYLYWKWSQTSLQFGTITTAEDTSANSTLASSSATLNPGYKSGFQTGIGFNMKGMDNWNLYSEYTWYRVNSSTAVTGTTANPFVPADSYFGRDSLYSGATLIGTIDFAARLGFQALDFLAQREFYNGKKLTAAFSTGLRAMWISQKYTNTSSSIEIASHADRTITGLSLTNKQTTWSLGPKFALDSNWLLGYGFKVMGNIAQSVLYSGYNTSFAASYTRAANATTVSSTGTGLDNVGTLTPVTETFLGLAWGGYFCDESFHADLSVGYNFDVYWEYDRMFSRNNHTTSNMYLQGLNVQLRFDF